MDDALRGRLWALAGGFPGFEKNQGTSSGVDSKTQALKLSKDWGDSRNDSSSLRPYQDA